MVGKYIVINLCGSMKFKEQYLEAQKRLPVDNEIAYAKSQGSTVGTQLRKGN
jgi:hypothetical protein